MTPNGPSLDNQGLNSIKMDQLASELREAGESAFRKRYACAFLVLKYGPHIMDDDIDLFTQKVSLPQLSGQISPLTGVKAMPLIKSDRNAFGSKISVGRVRNNDIVIRSAPVSKLHAAFHPEGKGGYKLQDMGSLNGTLVNGRRLAKKESVRLENGALISFWRYMFEFVTLDEMIARLEGG